MQGESKATPGRAVRTGALILLLALTARSLAAAGLAVIPRDGIAYLDLARGVAESGPAAAFRSIQHPLYPLVGGLLGGGETVLLIIGIVAGSSGCLAVFLIGRRVASRTVGVVAAILYAVSPAFVTYEASTLTEGLYIPLFLWSVALALAALDRPLRGIGGGILCGLAYLTRPDALLAGLAVPCGLLLIRRWRAAFLMGAGFLVLAGPYIYWMSADAGRLVVSRKKSRIERFADRDLPGADPAAPKTPRDSYGTAALDTARTLGEASSWVLLFLAAAGVIPALRGERRGAARLVLAMALLEVLVRLKLRHSFGYLAERHLLTSTALLLPFAARGLLLIPGRRAAAATAVVATVLLVLAVRPRRVEKLPLKEAGLWIRSVSGPGAVVGHHDLPRVAYYAEGESVNLAADPSGEAAQAEWTVRELAPGIDRQPPDRGREGRTFGSGKLRILVSRTGP